MKIKSLEKIFNAHGIREGQESRGAINAAVISQGEYISPLLIVDTLISGIMWKYCVNISLSSCIIASRCDPCLDDWCRLVYHPDKNDKEKKSTIYIYNGD